MKKTFYNLKYKPDPIVVGQASSKVKLFLKKISKCNSTIWTESRRLRDNGQIAKQQLSWKVDPSIKRNFYGKG
jgi:hypothetical protein